MDLPTSLPVPQLISSTFEDVESDSPETSFLHPSSRTTPVVNFGVKNLQEERPQNCENFDKSSPYTCPNTRGTILDLPEQMRSQKKYSKIPLEDDFGQLWSSEKQLSSASNQAKLVSAYSKSLPQSISATLGQIQDISKDDLCQTSAYCGQLCNDGKQSYNARTSLKKVSMDYLEVPHDFPSTVTTRRILSSNLGRVFDPLGLVTPVTILPKILFQMIWERHLGRDDDVGAHIGKLFHHWLASLKHLDSLEIPRKVTKNKDIVVNFDRSGLELHIFCDASESAYGFSIYARTPSATEGASSLLTAKSRLAPEKLQTAQPQLAELFWALSTPWSTRYS